MEKSFYYPYLFLNFIFNNFKVVTAIKAIKNGMYVISLSSSTNRLINIFKDVSKNEQILIDKSNPINKNKFEKHITIKNLSFSYDNENFKFENINFKINKSDKIIISGPSGSGKSTLVELLTGLNLPSFGQILIDDVDLKKCKKKNG